MAGSTDGRAGRVPARVVDCRNYPLSFSRDRLFSLAVIGGKDRTRLKLGPPIALQTTRQAERTGMAISQNRWTAIRSLLPRAASC